MAPLVKRMRWSHDDIATITSEEDVEAEAAEPVGCPESTEASAQGHDCIAIAVEDPECEDAVFEDTDWEDDSSEPEAEVEPQAEADIIVNRLTNFTKSGVPMSRRSRGSEECVCVCPMKAKLVRNYFYLSGFMREEVRHRGTAGVAQSLLREIGGPLGTVVSIRKNM